MVWLMMYVKDGAYAVLTENRCKMAIKHRFFNMGGSSLHSGKKCLNDSVTFVCPVSCFKKMETW
jgi:hypothetical protein